MRTWVVCVCVAACSPGRASGDETPPVDLFHPPTRLTARGESSDPTDHAERTPAQTPASSTGKPQAAPAPIDTGPAWGHSGPCLFDVDGDGRKDLVVGDFSGKFRLFKNVGSERQPEFAAAGYLQAGGVDAEVNIYCCIGSSPHFADLDGDGTPDLLSGSYDPGEFYLFRGLGGGAFAARETLCDRNGKAILRRPDQKQAHESFGSWIATVDWDDDGDLDLVLGGFTGEIFVRINEGTPTEPRFAVDNTEIEVNGETMKTPSPHAAVAVADWDGDGLWDILAGSDSGAVFLFRNIGAPGAPRFAAAETLVTAHQGLGYDEVLEAEDKAVPGIRSQICAADFDGDGKLDLLLGDFCTTISPRPDLTPEERAEFAAINEQIDEAVAVLRGSIESLRADFQKRYPGEALYSDEANQAWSEAYRALRDSDEYKAATARYSKLQQTQRTFLVPPPRRGLANEFATARGYVWLFRRK